MSLPASHDLRTLRERLILGVRAKRPSVPSDLPHWVEAQNADGSWSDIDYDNAQAASWDPNRHVARLRDIAGADTLPAYREALHRGLRYWFERDPLSPNWWFNQIGIPMQLGAILLLLGDDMTPEEKSRGLHLLRRSGWFLLTGRDTMEPIEWTGANLLWIGGIVLVRAVMEEDSDLVADVCRRVAGEIRIAGSGEEGIQEDHSFHQHGPLLFNGGYGASFTEDCLRFVALTAGTRWEFPASTRELLAAFLLDGQQWMRWGPRWDYSVIDRNIARPVFSREQSAKVVDYTFLAGERIEELKRFADSLNQWPAVRPALGNRHFWRSDFMVHRRENYSTSVRMSSIRTRTSECCNEEGKLSHHLGDGATYLYKTGNEYLDIFPIWDWRRVPGTTCVQRESLPREELRWQMGGPRTGGVSDGVYGLAAQLIARPELSAQKAWFYFDEGWICLGAAIESQHQEVALTSVEQCWPRGEVWIEANGQWREVGLEPQTACAVWHGGVGYLFLETSEGIVQKRTQTGSWQRVSPGPDEPISGEVFSLWLDHGARPSAAKYAYAVFPEIERSNLGKAASFFEILSNTAALQAVADVGGGIIQAVFWQPGTLQLPGGGTLEVDVPCLILLRAECEITLGDLDRTGSDARIIVTDRAGRRLRDGKYAFGRSGRSVTVK